MMKLTSDTLIPIGTAVGAFMLAAGAIYIAGGMAQEFEARAEDIEDIEQDVEDLEDAVLGIKDIQTRSIITGENVNTLLERQQRAIEAQEVQMIELQRQNDRLLILIERLSRTGGTMDP